MAVTIVESTIGTGGTFSDWTPWFAAGPRDATLNITANTGSGSTTTAIVLDATASATANAYVGNTLTIGSETLLITAYNTATKTATVGGFSGGVAAFDASNVATVATPSSGAVAFSTAPAPGTPYTIGRVIWRGKQKKQRFSGTGGYTFSGRTVDTTARYEFATDAGASTYDDPAFLVKAYRYDPAFAAVECTAGTTIAFDVQLPYSRITGLQFANMSASAGALYPLSAAADGIVLDKIIVESTANNPNATVRGVLRMSSNGGKLSNAGIFQRAAGDATATIATLSYNVALDNVTFAAVGGTKLSAGVALNYVAGTWNKVAVMGVTAPHSSNLTPAATSCATDGAQAGWLTTPFSTANFVSVATDGTHDLRLVSGSALIVAGSHDIGAWEFQAAPDTTAPTLTGPTATASGANSATGSVGTNEAGGTLYWIASSNATPLPGTVKLGSSQAVTATGAQNVVFPGLSPNTTYYPSFLQKDSAGNESTVVTGAAFTTPALDTVAPTWPNGASITPGTITTSSVAFSYPAASDNVGVAKYQTSKDGGATWQDNGTSLTGQFNGLASGTAFPIAVSALDAQSNRSALLTLSMSTSVAPNSASFKSAPLENNAGTLWTTGTMIKWEWRQARIGNQGTVIYGSSQVTSDGTITATGLPAGAGALLAEEPGASWATGSPCYQPGTAA